MLKKIFCLLSCILFTANVFAMSATGKTLTLTMLNNSEHTLTFDHTQDENPGNIFYVEPNKIGPHETAIITGIITKDIDLSGQLIFLDENNNENALQVLDPRTFHATEAVFNLHNSEFQTNVVSTKFSKSGNGRDLWVTDAKIDVNGLKQST